jgi:hypothetical protein
MMKVRGIASALPPQGTFQRWMQGPMRSTQFMDGLQAIEWTAEERGLAGLSDLEGIP